jgi:hypothetical protein
MTNVGDQAGAGASVTFEAEIRKGARPMLNPDERKAAAIQKAALESRYAAAKCREAAEAQLAKAKEYDAQASKLEKGK